MKGNIAVKYASAKYCVLTVRARKHLWSTLAGRQGEGSKGGRGKDKGSGNQGDP